MNDHPTTIPDLVQRAHHHAAERSFTMSCDHRTGSMLATLAASKPGGRLLEIGTGVGAGAAWLLAGMDPTATLTTIEHYSHTAAAARHVLHTDHRVTVVTADAKPWLSAYDGPPFDLVFVDWRIGKFEHRPLLLAQLAPGGLYVGDDLLPQPTWPADHADRVDQFLAEIPHEEALVVTLMAWASGLVVATRRADDA